MEVERMTSAGGPEPKPANEHDGKATYKSFKKKYRKMRIQFDQKISENQQNYKEEHRALETARRLAIENDQLLDLLLDVNYSAQIGPALRFDITGSESGVLEPLPDLVPSEAPIQCPTPEGEEIYKDILAALEKKRLQKENSTQPKKSLSSLLQTWQPKSLDSLPEDQRDDLRLTHPIAYLSPDQIDEATSLVDLSLNLEIAPTIHNPTALPGKLSDKQLEVQNPYSVYNWLRTNEPQVFLQDGEESMPTSAKPGSLRGAGKRGSLIEKAIMKTEPLPAFDDEEIESDTQAIAATSTPATGSKGAKGSKRKRNSEDDVGYRPKGGSRPTKKKKSEVGAGSASRRSSGPAKGSRKPPVAEAMVTEA